MALRLEQQTGVKRHIVTLDEYERMCAAGVFGPEARIELIRGAIVDMPPPGPAHEAVVARLNELFGKVVGVAALVWPQGNTIRLPQTDSQPQPDITILRRRSDYYARKPPVAEDVILVVEVAESSLKYDRGAKLALHAEAAIPGYWIVNLPKGVVEVYTGPDRGERKYQSVRIARRGETLRLPGDLEGSIIVDDVVG
jgi:Uma2 family endonuclease